MPFRFLLTILGAIAFAQANAAAPPAAEPTSEPPPAEAQEAIEQTASLESEQLAVIDSDDLAADIVPLTRGELASLAEQALALAKQRTVEMVKMRKTNPRLSTEPMDPDERTRATEDFDQAMFQLVDLRSDAFARLNLILDEWEEKGGDPKTIEEYRQYQRAVLSDTVTHLTIEGAWKAVKVWGASEDGGMRVLKAFGVFLLSLLALLIVARLVRAAVSRSLSHTEKISKLLQTFVALIVYWVTLLLGLALIIASLGFDVTPAFAVLGGASFVLAFALQETLGNFAAGLMILVYRPFDKGERIIAGGVDGTVRELHLTSTILVTPDNQLVTIPNAKVWNDVIVNAVDLDRRRVDLSFIVRDPLKAIEAMKGLPEMLLSQDHVLRDPAPEIYLGGYDGRGAELQIRPWVISTDYWPARRDLTRAIVEHFTKQGIALWVPPIESVGGD